MSRGTLIATVVVALLVGAVLARDGLHGVALWALMIGALWLLGALWLGAEDWLGDRCAAALSWWRERRAENRH